jgi:hypothetical protein
VKLLPSVTIVTTPRVPLFAIESAFALIQIAPLFLIASPTENP